MRSSRTFDGIEYAPGAQFRVVAEGLRLTGWVSSGRWSHSGWRQDLKLGDLLTCTGFGAGWGSDPGYGVEFTTPQSIDAHAGACHVTPSTGGIWAYRPMLGALTPIGGAA